MATIFSFNQLKPKASPLPPPRELAQPRDWTNQELSDLYRAIASLGQSGISVDMDRGLTDEGDPWMVLCRLDGDVFIHFCRLDGQYLLDSPVLPRPLRGRDFAELVNLFIAQASRAAAPNVVAFRANKVFLHPAALLTILVWSLYVWSSDTNQAQASELDDSGNSAAFPSHVLAPDQDTPDLAADAPAPPVKPALLVDGVPAERMATRLAQALDHAGSWATGNNVAAMQLLAVMSTLVLTSMSAGSRDAESDTAALLLDSPLPSDAPRLEQASADIGDDPSPEGAVTIPPVNGATAPASPSDKIALHDLATPPPHAALLLQHENAARDPVLLTASLAPAVFVHDTPLASGTDQIVLPSSAVPSHIALPTTQIADLLGGVFSFGRYEVHGLDLLASFNPADMDILQWNGQGTDTGLVDLLLDAPQADAPEPVQHGTFTEAARALLSAFLDQAGDLQIVASATELVLIDLTAFDDTMDRAYAYSWTMEDGGTISALGHVEFFAGYALV